MAVKNGNFLIHEENFITDFPEQTRAFSSYNPLDTFELPKGVDKHYQQQYADMYFLRLAQLKAAVEQKAQDAWENFELAGEKATRVERVLDVRQGELCWVVGTIFMEMTMKPNILDDISKEHWIAAPPVREKYISPNGKDEMMLEDESGRLRVTGDHVASNAFVTGCIIAALGTETADGAFEIIATQHADFPRQPQRWERDEEALVLAGEKVKRKRPKAEKIAIVSGLEIGADDEDTINRDILLEWLEGAAAGGAEQARASRITRLIIAGDSVANSSPIPSREEFAEAKKIQKRYGYDSEAYDAIPADLLDQFLCDLLPSIPITILPGASDPASVAIPQQPIHPAMFPKCRESTKPPDQPHDHLYAFDSVTNPWQGDVDGWRLLGTGGQTVTDVQKYIEHESSLDIMEAMLRWRCIAPTAPDTLWCYPFQDDDPLLVRDCPHVYFAGNQPKAGTKVVAGPAGQRVTLIAVPKFRDSGKVVLLDMETLGVDFIQIAPQKIRS
ncbi:hypothetical protein K432DRAFT_423807 [Lepidopterella palustris CBS 459.81]|uniref:DNA-directed DNA polymerase n=1 Tax=Lepidopterella palustris CBS 459.81 TaxID=1314670 RepID=A0A8E2EF99_9PEZI|nr:hypothetical protein K432DRAFT_423807 [Lepidopterella palustris CBS 459.81]